MGEPTPFSSPLIERGPREPEHLHTACADEPINIASPETSRHTFTFLGTGAGCGVPAFFCECPACQEARTNPRARRGDCGVMMEGTCRLVIDTPPDVRHQFIREGVRSIDRLMFTHAHFDHIGGLGELEYMVQLVTKHPLETYASERAFEVILNEFGYLAYCLDTHVLAPFDEMEFDGVRYTALPAAHAPGTFGYLIDTGAAKLFYASDTAALPPETAERVRDVDALILDSTFWKTNWNPESHHSVQQTIEEGLSLEAKRIFLTHLAMHYDEPITLAELEEYLAPYEGRVLPALDGMRLAV